MNVFPFHACLSFCKIRMETCGTLVMKLLGGFLMMFIILHSHIVAAGGLDEGFDLTWGGDRAKILNNGNLLTLSLDSVSGSGFQSKNEFMYGKIDMQMKLVAGNSAGTVTAYYMSSSGVGHDEIDFEFLGNLSGQPYTVHTNVYTQGKGDKEQQFHLWFDPTHDFHTYSILWNPHLILFMVDEVPIREYRNLESKSIPYPKNPMRLYSSIWSADDWATRGGQVKTDWSQAPFIASYRNFNAQGCIWFQGTCAPNSNQNGEWASQQLDSKTLEKLNWVKTHHMIYDYCKDYKRFAQGFPAECNA